MHQIEEIKRRLSVLENRLNIENERIPLESHRAEFARRLENILAAIKQMAKPVNKLDQVQIDNILKILTKHEKTLGITGENNPDAPPQKEITDTKYQTNFFKHKKGNAIRAGETLKVRIVGAEVVTGKIYNKDKVFQIDQSTTTDEDKDPETINFYLVKKRLPWRRWHRTIRNINYDKGKYTLMVWYWDGQNGGTYTDNFEII